jgi:uncharacterized RDD family membrane protein YckC
MQDAVDGADTRVYAGFMRRVSAYLVDTLVMLAPLLAIRFALERGSFWTPVLQLAAWWIYKAGLESGPRQATLGKRALGIKVTRLQGERVSFARATGRFFAMMVSGFILGIGFLMAAFTRRKQALHDLMASCLVVRADATPEEIAKATGTMPLTFGAFAGAVVAIFFPILGILAAVAIPMYADYGIQRSMAAAALAEGSAWKPRAEAAFDQYARNPGSQPMIEANGTSGYVSRVVIRNPERRLELHLDASRFRTPLIASDARIDLTLEGPGRWRCSAHGVPPRYLPVACRR